MSVRWMVVPYGFLFTTVFLVIAFGTKVQADSPPLESPDSFYDEWSEKAKEGKKVRFTGTHYYWDEGFHIVSRRENFRLKIGGKFILDGGYIDANKELEGVFLALEGYGGDFRFLSVDFTGTIRPLSALSERSYAPYDALAFKLEIDFANVREVKDIWLRFPGIPLLGYFTFGHMKEPFSLETSTSITSITFMERALPNEAFAAIRNMGIRFDKPILNERVTLAAGGFGTRALLVMRDRRKIGSPRPTAIISRRGLPAFHGMRMMAKGSCTSASRTTVKFGMTRMWTIAHNSLRDRSHALRMRGLSMRLCSRTAWI